MSGVETLFIEKVNRSFYSVPKLDFKKLDFLKNV